MWLEITLCVFVLALVIAFCWQEYWIRSLVCPRCGASATANYRRTDKLICNAARAKAAVARERGWLISGAPIPVVRFPCERCKTIIEESGSDLVVSESQEFEWPDPEAAAQKLVENIEYAIRLANEEESSSKQLDEH